MRIEGMKIGRQGDIKPSDILIDLIKEKAKEVKLTMPFKADGFKAEKQPTQPDGVTPMVVEPANIGAKIEVKQEEPKTEPEIEHKIEPKVTKEVTKPKKAKKTKKGGK